MFTVMSVCLSTEESNVNTFEKVRMGERGPHTSIAKWVIGLRLKCFLVIGLYILKSAQKVHT